VLCCAMPVLNTTDNAAANAILRRARSLFKAADSDGNGWLNEDELETLAMQLHETLGLAPLTSYQVEELFMTFDVNHDGRISFKEFVAMLSNPPWVELFPTNAGEALKSLAEQIEESPTKDKAPGSPIKTHALDTQGVREGGRVVTVPGHRERKHITKSVNKEAAVKAAAIAIRKEAKRVYEKFDTNGDGFIDEEELVQVMGCLIEVLGKEKPPARQMEEHARQAMAEFDTNENGHLEFSEFLVMITVRPWKHLLPAETQALMSGRSTSPRRAPSPRKLAPPAAPSAAIARATVSSASNSLGNHRNDSAGVAMHAEFAASKRNDGGAMAAAAAQAAFRREAKKLFLEADADNNGMVDEAELCHILARLHSSHGQAHIPSDFEVRQEAQGAMAAHGVSGGIPYEGFQRLLASPIFASILPREMQALVPEQAREDAKRELGKNTAKAAAGVAVMRAARQIFEAADSDKNGSIDRDELAWLVLTLWDTMGITVPQRYENQLENEVDAAMARYDTNRDGVISFKEFMNMITSEPWRALLPIEVQDQVVPYAGEAAVKAPAPVVIMPGRAPADAMTGALGAGGRKVAPGRAPAAVVQEGGYDLVGPPQTVRAMHGLARGHTRDLQYAMQETQLINSRLAARHSVPHLHHLKRRQTLPSGFIFHEPKRGNRFLRA